MQTGCTRHRNFGQLPPILAFLEVALPVENRRGQRDGQKNEHEAPPLWANDVAGGRLTAGVGQPGLQQTLRSTGYRFRRCSTPPETQSATRTHSNRWELTGSWESTHWSVLVREPVNNAL